MPRRLFCLALLAGSLLVGFLAPVHTGWAQDRDPIPRSDTARAAAAEPFDLTTDSLREVSLQEALRLFGENNLSLRRLRADVREAEARIRRVRAYPNPQVRLTHEPLRDGGQSQSESYATLSQQLVWGGRGSRREAARRTAAATRARAEADSARLALVVVETYVRAATAQRRWERVRAVTQVMRQVEASAQEKTAGYAARRLRLERARYEDRLAAVALEVQDARRQLALLIGPESAPSVAAGTLPSGMPPGVREADAVRTALRRRPELRRWRETVEARLASAEAARREGWPGPTLTAGYKRQSDGFEGAFLGVSLPLPVFDRGRGAVQAQEAGIDAAQARTSLARREIRNDVRRAHSAYTSARRRTELLGGDLAGEAGALLRAARDGYASGETSLLTVLDAADAHRDAHARRLRLHRELWTRYVRLLHAMGRPLRLP
jgi:cobalt-zinc-cadmium efflux system outer membrane protein